MVDNVSVAAIVSNITANQGAFVEGKLEEACKKVDEDVKKMLEENKKLQKELEEAEEKAKALLAAQQAATVATAATAATSINTGAGTVSANGSAQQTQPASSVVFSGVIGQVPVQTILQRAPSGTGIHNPARTKTISPHISINKYSVKVHVNT